jgi:hypothetical protein
MRERVRHREWAGVLLLALVLLVPATAAGARGLGADKARALADTLAAYNAGGSGANIEIGACTRRSTDRTDCQDLRVSSSTGAARCQSVTALFKRGGRFQYALDFAADSCRRARAISPGLRRHRVPAAVVRSLSAPPEVLVSCPAGLPGCPSKSDLPRCLGGGAACPPVAVHACAQSSADCPALVFRRCPADKDACPQPPPSGETCFTEAAGCGTPVIACTIQPTDCSHPATQCNLVNCGALQPVIGCATGATLCPPVVAGSGSQSAGGGLVCIWIPHKRWLRRPPPARKRVHVSRRCRTV